MGKLLWLERIGGLILTATGYLFGVGRLVAICVPAYFGARAWRRHAAPDWTRALATLADIIGALAGVVVVSELLGSVGQFRRPTFVIAALGVGLGSVWWCRRHSTSEPDRAAPALTRKRVDTRLTRPARDVIVASASTALVLAQWSTWVANAISVGIGNAGGPGNGDTLWYHMPFAAAFVQTGWTSHLQFLNGEALVTYYPANTSLLHAVGILAMRTDVLSVFVNVALVPVALLAGWCIGERVGVAPASLAGVAVALTIPIVVVSEAGTAKDDMLGIVGLLACIAFVVHSRRHDPVSEDPVSEDPVSEDPAPADSAGSVGSERAASVYGGLAAGLALGAKLTLVAPILALAVGLTIFTPARARVSTMARWGAAAFVTGGYWYLRNLIAVGNPLPGLGIGIGSFRLPRPPTPSMDDFGTDLLRNVSNSRIWHDALLPGLRTGFGSAWPVMIIVATVATVVGVVRLRGRELVAPVVGFAAFAAFVITPGTVWAPQLIKKTGVHLVTANLFAFNLRYMLPAVAIGLVIVPLVARNSRHGPMIATAALGFALAATQLSPQSRQSWSRHHVLVGLIVAAITAVAMVALTSGRPLPTLRATTRNLTLCGAVIAVIAIGWPVQLAYQNGRYARIDLARWANKLQGARIGYSGFVFSYPLYGSRLQNHVQMIGEHGPHGAWGPAPSCPAWRLELQRANVKYVVVPIGPPSPGLGIDLARWRVGLPGGEPPDEPPESSWTRSDPALHRVFVSTDSAAVYEVTGPETTAGCRK